MPYHWISISVDLANKTYCILESIVSHVQVPRFSQKSVWDKIWSRFICIWQLYKTVASCTIYYMIVRPISNERLLHSLWIPGTESPRRWHGYMIWSILLPKILPCAIRILMFSDNTVRLLDICLVWAFCFILHQN